ncbi:MAG: radical SAM protein [Phycisphaerae bacterium]|nr:radical SAM protein [Phycisphaerae bacterium]
MTTPSVIPPLRLLFWESTSQCNLACVHCRRQDTSAGAAKEDLSTAQAKALMESVATLPRGAGILPALDGEGDLASSSGQPYGVHNAGGTPASRGIFVFSGGEPLLRADWEELADFARQCDLTTALATNGTLVDGAMAGRIASAGFHRVSVSLDGADAAVHDAFRASAGAFDLAMAGVSALRAAGVSVQINATISRHNLHQLDALCDRARERGACALHLFLLVPVGCGARIEATHQLPAAQYERVLNWLCDRQAEIAARGERFELKATCAPHYTRVAATRQLRDAGVSPASNVPLAGSRKDVKPTSCGESHGMHSAGETPAPRKETPAPRGGGCLCGTAVAFVSHRGQVFPCGYLPVACGDVRTENFADIWRDSPVFAALRRSDNRGGKCGRCEFRPRCGGCRARAFAATGDYLAEEPFCGKSE